MPLQLFRGGFLTGLQIVCLSLSRSIRILFISRHLLTCILICNKKKKIEQKFLKNKQFWVSLNDCNLANCLTHFPQMKWGTHFISNETLFSKHVPSIEQSAGEINMDVVFLVLGVRHTWVRVGGQPPLSSGPCSCGVNFTVSSPSASWRMLLTLMCACPGPPVRASLLSGLC